MLKFKLEPINTIEVLSLSEVREKMKSQEHISLHFMLNKELADKLKDISDITSCPISSIINAVVNQVVDNKGFIESVKEARENEED